MKVLWVTNIPLPEASLLMNEKPVPYGGWLINAAIGLVREKGIKLAISFPKKNITGVKKIKGEGINYYPFSPVGDNLQSLEDNPNLMKIIDDFEPDLVHIFGTEYSHSLAMINICKKKNIHAVISIQGLVSFIAKHYLNGIPARVRKQYTFRDFIKLDNLKQQQRKFMQQGLLEEEALQKAIHVIGRTTWDKACTTLINSNINYHYCSETMRDAFYKDVWRLEKCERYSIFISQGSYPLKGLHFILESMPIILKQFPSAKLYIGGQNITITDNFKQTLKISSYGKYIKKLIKKYNLQNNVVFTGVLSEEEMRNRYIKSHVFVCPSSIENSSNSLGEAMLLGVPSIASDVGGISDLLTHKEEGFLYQADAPYMLAYYISEIFKNNKVALRLSGKSRKKALKLYDKEQNLNRLIEIYNEINAEGENQKILGKRKIYESNG